MAFNETKARRNFELSDEDVANMSEEQRTSYGIGLAVFQLLLLKKNPKGRVATSWGSKTAIGLGRCIRRITGGN